MRQEESKFDSLNLSFQTISMLMLRKRSARLIGFAIGRRKSNRRYTRHKRSREGGLELSSLEAPEAIFQETQARESQPFSLHNGSEGIRQAVYSQTEGEISKITSPMTTGQMLAMDFTGYKKELQERYFEAIYYNEGEPDKQLAKEMFQAFNLLSIIRFGDVFFTREGI